MQINDFQPIVILEVNSESIEQDKAIISEFLGKPYKRENMLGCYNGTESPSYIIEVTSENPLGAILEFAENNNQESILYLDNQRNAYLYYTDGGIVSLGRFISTNEIVAKSKDCWTYNPETKVYYITTK